MFVVNAVVPFGATPAPPIVLSYLTLLSGLASQLCPFDRQVVDRRMSKVRNILELLQLKKLFEITY